MKKMIICAAFAFTLVRFPFFNIGFVVDGNGYHLDDGNAAIIVEVPLYDDVQPVAMYVIN